MFFSSTGGIQDFLHTTNKQHSFHPAPPSSRSALSMPLISILLKWETLDISMSVSVKTNLKGYFFVWLVSQLNLVVKVSLLFFICFISL